MTVSKRLAAHRAAAPSASATDNQQVLTPEDRPDEETSDDKSKPEESPMTEEEIKAAIAMATTEATATATAAANARYAAVMASEHFPGREKVAASLLSNEAMTADSIISTLALIEKPAATTTNTGDAEAAARAEMQAAIAEGGNSNIDAGGSGQKPKEASSADVWAAAHAGVFPEHAK